MAHGDSFKYEDGCGVNSNPSIKRANFLATIWFFSAICFAVVLVTTLCKIDFNLYTGTGDFLNYKDYKANRDAFSSIPSESIDERRSRSAINP